ncbi:hypothetical protein [Pseudosulfitobacter sp. DSM 107133]|uniref:hypothetical protein n=1 Tax=Pseudosulfitobacter sp. DSM 107133 TaxID=2883100 RepID=UPI0013B3AAC4|nr:hypothetical protein [Pseudosulfitobacter sp. DSM 107133]UOA29212.1 hypothetical protein DSM107133_03973 [Pseudosulfitobacter sp. DSM 107133]
MSNAVWALARDNTWYREGEQAARYLQRPAIAVDVRNAAAMIAICKDRLAGFS